MKLLIAVVIILCSSYIGYGVGNYYKIRQNFYKDFIVFLETCEMQITFYHNKISAIFDDFLSQTECSKEFKKFLIKIKNQFENNNEIIIESVFINASEQKLLSIFFNNLGKTNSDNQQKMLEFNKTQFKIIANDCEAQKNKNSPLAVKLGFLFGLALAICFI